MDGIRSTQISLCMDGVTFRTYLSNQASFFKERSRDLNKEMK